MFGTNTPIIVELSGSLQYHLIDHFKEEGLTDEEISHVLQRYGRWYGIIDGAHSNEAVRYLSTTNPAWKGFQWFVTVL